MAVGNVIVWLELLGWRRLPHGARPALEKMWSKEFANEPAGRPVSMATLSKRPAGSWFSTAEVLQMEAQGGRVYRGGDG